nr:actin cytoskeleton-regulatory complex protein PAN1-like [Quercus suber]
MGIQRKPQRSLMDLIEDQPGRGVPRKSTQPQLSPPPKSPLPPPSTSQPSRPEAHDPKRRREPKDKNVVETGGPRPTHEDEIQHAAKEQKLDDERKRQAIAVQTLIIAEQSNTQLKKKLVEEEHARKSADSALENAERQAKASKEEIINLKKQLEQAQRLKNQAEKAKGEAEKAKAMAEKEKDEVEQHGYDVGVAETENNLRAKVPVVCRAYFAESAEGAQTQILPPLNQQEQPKIPDALREGSSDKLAEVPKDGAVSQSFEQALASTVLPTKEIPKGKEKEVPPEATDKAPKSKIQIKLKP